MPAIPLWTFVSLILGVRCTKWTVQASDGKEDALKLSRKAAFGSQPRRAGASRDRCSNCDSNNDRMVLVNIETGAANRKQQRHKRCRYSAANWFAAVLAMACLSTSVPTIAGQSSPSTTPSTQQEPQSIPDAPSTVQPPADKPEPPPSP